MSINQAAIHYNLPYSSLYGRFKRGKFDTEDSNHSNGEMSQGMMLVNYPDGYTGLQTYHQQPGSWKLLKTEPQERVLDIY